MTNHRKGFISLPFIVAIVVLVVAIGVGIYYYASHRGAGPQIISPAGGEVWAVGGTYQIKWTGITSPRAAINYTSPVGSGDIVTVDNNGTYEWTISTAFKPSDKYYIVVVGHGDEVAYSAPFKIVSPGTAGAQPSTSGTAQTSPLPSGGSSALPAGLTCLPMPAGFRSDVPLPPQSCIIQATPLEKNGYKGFAVFAMTTMSPEGVTSFLDANLSGNGWQPGLRAEQLVTLPGGSGAAGHSYMQGDIGLTFQVIPSPQGTQFMIGYSK